MENPGFISVAPPGTVYSRMGAVVQHGKGIGAYAIHSDDEDYGILELCDDGYLRPVDRGRLIGPSPLAIVYECWDRQQAFAEWFRSMMPQNEDTKQT